MPHTLWHNAPCYGARGVGERRQSIGCDRCTRAGTMSRSWSRLLAAILAAPAILHAQACLPQLFQTGAFASLTPSGSSQQILLRQNDGSYTAFEIPDTAPYKVLSTTPSFGQQLRNCPNPEPSDISPPINRGIYAATPSGGVIFVSGILLFPMDSSLSSTSMSRCSITT